MSLRQMRASFCWLVASTSLLLLLVSWKAWETRRTRTGVAPPGPPVASFGSNRMATWVHTMVSHFWYKLEVEVVVVVSFPSIATRPDSRHGKFATFLTLLG